MKRGNGLAGILVLLIAPLLNADVISTFDSGTDGWTLAPGSFGTLGQSPSGGNPGGYLKNDPTDGADVAIIMAPSTFTGDLRQYDGGTLSFDATMVSRGGSDYSLFGVITLKSGSDSRELDIVSGAPPLGAWGSYSAPMDASTWGFATDAGWRTFLAGITEITIGAEAIFGPEVNGFDNIALARGPLSIGLTGSCPSALTLTVRGASRGGDVAIVRAFRTGSQVIPNGYPCAGTTLGLGNTGLDLALVLQADATGYATATRAVPADACGSVVIQALDIDTCETSNVVAVN